MPDQTSNTPAWICSAGQCAPILAKVRHGLTTSAVGGSRLSIGKGRNRPETPSRSLADTTRATRDGPLPLLIGPLDPDALLEELE
jgi:hypothetical protein